VLSTFDRLLSAVTTNLPTRRAERINMIVLFHVPIPSHVYPVAFLVFSVHSPISSAMSIRGNLDSVPRGKVNV
jgi:hypothetical protein